jgi:hypothetical protein
MTSYRQTNQYNSRSLCSATAAPSSHTDWKSRANNNVPLSTASTAAPSPRAPLTNSPPPGFCDPPLLATPGGTFSNDCPPSPMLTKRLLAQAQARKRAGRHNLVSSSGGSSKRILRLSVPVHLEEARSTVDRLAIPEDLYNSFLGAASKVKTQSGQHRLQRRRKGLSGSVEHALVMQSVSTFPSSCNNPRSSMSIFSPDPSLF